MGTSYAAQACGAFGSACSNGTGALPIECGQPGDCTANGVANAVCCLQGLTGTPGPETGCGNNDLFVSGGTGVACVVPDGGASDGGGLGTGACGSGALQICAQQADCPSGTTCTPMHWKLYDIGFCQ